MRDHQRSILERMRALVCECDERGHMLYVSPSVRDVLGYEPGDVRGGDGSAWVHPEDRGKVAESFGKAVATGHPARLAYRARHADGHWVWLETTGRSYRAEDGSLRFVVFTRDVDELHAADAALRESQERWRLLTENASDLISEMDDEGRYVYISPSCRPLLGVEPEFFIGYTSFDPHIADRVHPEDRERVLHGVRARLRDSGSGAMEYRFQHRDGSWLWVESTVCSYRTSEGALHAVVVSRDVTARRRAERELRESEERYRVMTEATRDVVTEVDAEGRLLYVSSTIKDALGYLPEELVGTTPMPLLVHPDEVEKLAESFVEGVQKKVPTYSAPFRMRHRDGSWRWFDSRAVPYRRADGETRMLSSTRDITEQVRAEEQQKALEARMQHTQKLESLGAMAGGIAHDFNNLLTPILGDASLALMDLPADSPLRARLLGIQRAAHRAAALTNQMLAYAGKRPLVMEPVNLSRLVLEMAQLVESAIESRAALSFDMAADLPLVEGDVSQLCQVVMAVVTNASEAIGKRTGRIELRTGTLASRRMSPRATVFGELRDGPYVFLEVQDTGCGMDQQTRSRIFDPFYTTKFVGRGLGLAATLGIVRGHLGVIELESEPGRGTRFRILLPAARTQAPRETRVEPAVDRSTATLAMVVDDDEAVRELVRETLERAGLPVVCAAEAHEALRVFGERPEQIGLVLLDRTLPGTPGVELFDALRAIRANLPVVLMSGYGERDAAARFAGKGLAGFLQKPFEPDALVERVRAVLGT